MALRFLADHCISNLIIQWQRRKMLHLPGAQLSKCCFFSRLSSDVG